MKTIGIIAEYNPFHNGHKYQIEEAKRITGADYVVIIMSGNFVQRGTPAICNKYLRCDMALSNGADLVIELPYCYATSSAEFFATGAISLLKKLEIIDYISFGCEVVNNTDSLINDLENIASFFSNEPDDYKLKLNKLLKEGYSFPAARAKSAKDFLSEREFSLIELPNNILAIEYLKAMKKLDCSFAPIPINRTDLGYHSKEISEKFSSATAIRNIMSKSIFSDVIISSVPQSVLNAIKSSANSSLPLSENDFSLLLGMKLLEVSDPSELCKYQDISLDLAMRIFNLRNNFKTFSQFAELLKTKDRTLLSINRALLHILLNVKTSDLTTYIQNNYHEYIRILGFKKESSILLTQIKEHSTLPIITKLADATLTDLLKNNIAADNFYRMVTMNKFDSALPNEFSSGLIIK